MRYNLMFNKLRCNLEIEKMHVFNKNPVRLDGIFCLKRALIAVLAFLSLELSFHKTVLFDQTAYQ